jgi:uncharacterized circularly permuted ATP-grasp superfamily protein/uncharacterized alpha-E superfamily protein
VSGGRFVIHLESSSSSARHDLLAQYERRPGVYDELFATGIAPLPHWEHLLQNLQSLSREELFGRDREIRRLLRENGVTYNARGEDGAESRSWGLDPVPTLYRSDEWAEIEAGLAQRAELLSEVLRDIYGERKLIRRGLLPAELVYAHRGFLRPCVGAGPAWETPIHFYAADLVRGRDGALVVIADRTQAPSGAGYALENRIVIKRVFPSIYREANVHKLAAFFRTLRHSLSDLAQDLDDNPSIVVMSPGMGSETFFEQSYLAKYLGYSLTTGKDLVINNGKVYLRTLRGLSRVHVIWRRVDDGTCDPLELRRDSVLGTPGLMEAARSGQVLISNPLGSGFAENTGLLAYLPRLCRELLGQDLLIPSAATWWCGDATARTYVLERLDQLVIKSIHPREGFPLFAGELSATALDDLRRAILRRPHLYVGQAVAASSTAPCLRDTTLVPRPVVLRTFLVARNGSYQTMPGGLTRAATDRDELFVTNQRGGTSKDTWVMASEREERVTTVTSEPPATVAVALSRAGGEVPSSVADHLFWMGRYAERIELAIRVLRELYTRIDDSQTETGFIPRLLPILTHATGTWPGFVGEEAEPLRDSPDDELFAVFSDSLRIGTIASNIQRLKQNAVAISDRFSDDGWLVVQAILDEAPGDQLVNPLTHSESIRVLERLLILLGAFSGLCVESMSRSQGFHFVDVGRRLERGLGILALLRSTLLWTGRYEPNLLPFLLAVNDNRTTYSRRYQLEPQLGPVLDLFLLDETNPRSFEYQRLMLANLLAALPNPTRASKSGLSDLLKDLKSHLNLVDADSLGLLPSDPTIQTILESQLDRFVAGFDLFATQINQLYFQQPDLPQQMVAMEPAPEPVETDHLEPAGA